MGMTGDPGGPRWVEPRELTACSRYFQDQAAHLLEQAIANPNLAGRVQFETPFDWPPHQILADLRGMGNLAKLRDLVRTFATFGYRLKLEMEPIEEV